ncbi:UNVERIFIED_CONTAM: hypothetical protein FKN15_037336 [Acipenser sinensis]
MRGVIVDPIRVQYSEDPIQMRAVIVDPIRVQYSEDPIQMRAVIVDLIRVVSTEHYLFQCHIDFHFDHAAPGLTGPDCSLSVPSTESYWVLPNVKPFSPSVSRTSHKTVMHGKFMWVIGGYTFNYSSFQMVLKTILKESGLARYLHSAVILSGVVLVFGGNTHNDTALSNGAKCFSSDFIAYDIACDEWKMLPKPSLHRDVNRFGHSAVISNGSMYVFGGFSGVLLNDILVYKLPNCEAFRAEEPCLDAGPGIRCLWGEDRCVSWDPRHTNGMFPSVRCPQKKAHLCGEGWSHVGDACLRINASRDSYDNAKLYCYNLSGNLASLTTSKEVDFVLDELHKYTVQKISPWVGLRKINISYWGWEDMSPFTNTTMQWQPGEPNDSGFCAYLEKAEVAGLKANPCTAMADGLICEKPVAQNCSGLRTCSQCLEQPGCGWCNDPSNTGKGQCIEGSSRGPMKGIGKQSQDLVLDQGLCPKDKSFEWAFIHCPACQCNGHSTCVNSSVCEQCKNLTTGKQCEACMAGYYGDPTNGGKCQGEFDTFSIPVGFYQPVSNVFKCFVFDRTRRPLCWTHWKG